MTTRTALLSMAEVARELHVSRRTVERLVKAGQIRALHIGRRRLVEPAEVKAYIAAARRAA